MPVITMPTSLREEFTPRVCDGFLELIKLAQEDQRQDVLAMVRDNFGRQVAESEARLRVEIAESESRLQVQIAESEGRLRVEFAEKLANVKTSLLAWMFVFWIGQAATIIGMMALLLKR